MKDNPSPTTEPIAEIRYGADAAQTGDLFLPQDVSADTPVVLNIHGGGWSTICSFMGL